MDVPRRDTDVGNGKKPSEISNNLGELMFTLYAVYCLSTFETFYVMHLNSLILFTFPHFETKNRDQIYKRIHFEVDENHCLR